MLIYFLKVNLLLLLFAGFYWLFLRNGKLLRLNRVILLSSIVLSFVLPALSELPAFHSIASSLPGPALDWAQLENNGVGEAVTENVSPTELTTEAGETAWSIYSFKWFFLGVSLLFLLSLCRQFIRLLGIIIYGKNQRSEGFTLVYTEQNILPFSFFRYLVVNPRLHDSSTLSQIIAHEKEHIFQHHYADILIVELLRILSWYNPAVWLFGRMLRMNLEFLADAGVMNRGYNRKEYQFSLLRLSTNRPINRLITPINYSPLKTRIAMMNSKKPNVRHALPYFFFPLLLAMAWSAINPITAQSVRVNSSSSAAEGAVAQTADKPSSIISGEEKDIYLVIRKDTKRKLLDEAIAEMAKHGVKFSIDNINYNDGEITSIRISGSSHRAMSFNSQSDPFSGPLVFYSLDSSDTDGIIGGDLSRLTDEQKVIVNNLSGLLIRMPNGKMTMKGTFNIPAGW